MKIGCQNLRYTLLDLESYDIVQEGKIPLPKKTTLTWLGFTSDGVSLSFHPHDDHSPYKGSGNV